MPLLLVAFFEKVVKNMQTFNTSYGLRTLFIQSRCPKQCSKKCLAIKSVGGSAWLFFKAFQQIIHYYVLDNFAEPRYTEARSSKPESATSMDAWSACAAEQERETDFAK